MGVHKIKKGIKLPFSGEPAGSLIKLSEVSEVAILGDDFPGLKPAMLVKVGDKVNKGEPLFTDRKNEESIFTAPASGVVKSINRGLKRKFLSLVIEKEEGSAIKFEIPDVASSGFDNIYKVLKESGLLTQFRQYPFAKCPTGDKPDAIFINCMDTRPGAPDMSILREGRDEYFTEGVNAVKKLAEKVFICCDESACISEFSGVKIEKFSGVHPAGLTGTHIHFLRPASMQKRVWALQMQDVIDIGYLFTHGELNETRRISICGSSLSEPCHVETVKGAPVDEILKNKIMDDEYRVINGSVFYGFEASGDVGYLSGCFNQLTVIPEQTDRVFFGWATLRNDLHSVKNIFLSKFTGEKSIRLDSSLNGSKRPMVPVGTYEKVMPLDILPTYLLRALEVGDYEMAEKLGCLELSEEDLSLCTYVCPGKIDYAPLLRDVLTVIEKEG